MLGKNKNDRHIFIDFGESGQVTKFVNTTGREVDVQHVDGKTILTFDKVERIEE